MGRYFGKSSSRGDSGRPDEDWGQFLRATGALPRQAGAADVDRVGMPIGVGIHGLSETTRRLPERDRRARVLASLCVQDRLVPDSWNPLDGNFVWNKQWRARRMARNPAARAMYEQAMAEFRQDRAARN